MSLVAFDAFELDLVATKIKPPDLTFMFLIGCHCMTLQGIISQGIICERADKPLRARALRLPAGAQLTREMVA
jgi:hypothetical protein